MSTCLHQPALFGGWYQIAFTRELESDVTPAQLGHVPLVIVKTSQGVRIFDATCPHRGAHLGYGGELVGDAIACPFHGHRVHLGRGTRARFAVREYHTLDLGGMVFVLLSAQHENGLAAYLRGLARTHSFTPGFLLGASVPPQYVIENAFDAAHFQAVHGVTRRPALKIREDAQGALVAESIFKTNRPSLWRKAALATADVPTTPNGVALQFVAHAFSPTLVATELRDGEDAHMVITAATPRGDGTTGIRVSAAVPRDSDPAQQLEVVRRLLHDSQTAFAQDLAVWKHLILGAPQRFAPGDAAVIRFRAFCERLRLPADVR
jgi:3-ketosteroid 9alpha-monooxygenase subunit A